MTARKHPRFSGVFDHLVNSAAFIDTVAIELWGKRRTIVPSYMSQKTNRAIGGNGRAYARCIPGRNKVTGNKVQLKYGIMLPYRNISPFLLIVWANRVPVTCADVMLAANAFLRIGFRARVSWVELTFDTSGIALEQFVWELCTRARSLRDIESRYGTTLYVGGVNSSWRLKIYQKTAAIVRVEFTFARRFLEGRRIVKPHDLARFRNESVWDCASFRRVDQSRGTELPQRIRDPWTQLGHGLPPDVPPSIVEGALREARILPRRWVVASARERLLRKMLSNLVW